jgi:xylulokinase
LPPPSAHRSELLLGIDVGSSSTKGVLVDPAGAIVARSERRHALSLPRPGWVEHDAEAVWWADVRAIARDLAPQAGAALHGVCVSGIGPCVVPCDAQDRPLRPAILYGIDTRASAETAELTERYGEAELLARGGSLLSSQAVGPKLLWLRRHEPAVWERADRWHMASSFAVARLTGEHVLDHHSASQCDPLYDLGRGGWAEDLVQDLAPGIGFPSLAWPGTVVGRVHAAAAAETGLPEGLPVILGTVDAWAEAFSCGVRRPGDLMVMYGTTMFFVQVVADANPHEVLWLTQGVEAQAPTLAAGMSTSGAVADWVRDVAGGPAWEQLVEEAAAVPPGARGLLMLPYFEGERTPIYDPRARGAVVGLTLSHGRAELLRAAYEGVAFGAGQILGAFSAAAAPASRVVAVGGGSRSALWTQIVSDVTGVAQRMPEVTVGASYGDALLAAIGTGLVPAETDWARTAHVVTPDAENAAVYERLSPLFAELYAATRSVVHRLADEQAR